MKCAFPSIWLCLYDRAVRCLYITLANLSCIQFFINVLISKQRVKKKNQHYIKILFCKKIPVNVNKRTQKLWNNVRLSRGGERGDKTCISYEVQYAVKRLNISIKLLRSCSYLASKACVCKLLKHFPNFRLDFKRNAFCARRHSQTQITTCFDTGKINVFMETSQRLITVDSSKTCFIEW